MFRNLFFSRGFLVILGLAILVCQGILLWGQYQIRKLHESEKKPNLLVSPYGLGPYPELPEGWAANIWPCRSKERELEVRVHIKLLSLGINAIDATTEDGLVYPTIKNTVYLRWVEEDGDPYVSDLAGDRQAYKRLITIMDAKGSAFTEADIPSDIKTVSFEEGGINPYEFLGLPKR